MVFIDSIADNDKDPDTWHFHRNVYQNLTKFDTVK